jgi:hypothetical protein
MRDYDPRYDPNARDTYKEGLDNRAREHKQWKQEQAEKKRQDEKTRRNKP